MNDANGIQIGWPKLDKRHLAKIMESQGFYVCRLQLDPCPHVDVELVKEKGLFGYCSTIVCTCFAFSQKISTGMNIFFALENIY